MKKTKRFLTVMVLFLAVFSACISFSSCKVQEWQYEWTYNMDGYWVSEDESFLLNSCFGYVRIRKDGKDYYIKLLTGPPLTFSSFHEAPYLTADENQVAFLLTASYDFLFDTVGVKIYHDNMFGLEGKKYRLYFVPSENAPDNVLKNQKWMDEVRGDTYDFVEENWQGNIDGSEKNGAVFTFPDAEVFRLLVSEGEYGEESYVLHVLEGKLTEKTEDTVTVLITDATGAFADRVGETFTLTKVAE